MGGEHTGQLKRPGAAREGCKEVCLASWLMARTYLGNTLLCFASRRPKRRLDHPPHSSLGHPGQSGVWTTHLIHVWGTLIYPHALQDILYRPINNSRDFLSKSKSIPIDIVFLFSSNFPMLEIIASDIASTIRSLSSIEISMSIET